MRKYMSAEGFAHLVARVKKMKRGQLLYEVDTELYPHQMKVFDDMKGYTIVAVRENNDVDGKTPFFFCIGLDADRDEMFAKIKSVLAEIGGKNIEITRNQ